MLLLFFLCDPGLILLLLASPYLIESLLLCAISGASIGIGLIVILWLMAVWLCLLLNRCLPFPGNIIGVLVHCKCYNLTSRMRRLGSLSRTLHLRLNLNLRICISNYYFVAWCWFDCYRLSNNRIHGTYLSSRWNYALIWLCILYRIWI